MRSITINGVNSYSNLGQLVAEAILSPPQRKLVTETVPYMSGFYDFSSLGGEPAYESRTLEVRMQVVGTSEVDLESKVSRLIEWAAGANDSAIYDSSLGNYHLVGSYSKCKRSRVGGHIDELTMEFTCQPFKVSNSGGGQII